jgi:hypothetical protein
MAISNKLPKYTPVVTENRTVSEGWEAWFRNFANTSLILDSSARGFFAQTGASSYANRLLQASTGIEITNANGVDGNPIIAVSNIPQSSVTNLTTDLAAKAPLASPTFTGTVTISANLTLGATAVTATGAEINKLDGAPFDATFTIGSEAGDVINVAVQLKDANGANLSTLSNLTAYLSDNSSGNNFIATAPSGTVVIGTNGALFDVGSAKKVFHLISNATGQVDINITESGAKTLYLVLVLPNGLLKVSSAITFA